MQSKAFIGITMGDPAGIGPELCLDILNDLDLIKSCHIVVLADFKTLSLVAKKTNKNLNAKVIGINKFSSNVFSDKSLPLVVDFTNVDHEKIIPGKVNEMTGRASFDYIVKSIEFLKMGYISAIVTNPISKLALSLGGINFPGHTEIFKEYTSTNNVTMLFYSNELICALVTTHIGLSDVSSSLNVANVLNAIKQSYQFLRKFKGDSICIGVLGLNPHSGESGLFGNEEESLIIEPAITSAQKIGINAIGPISPDTAFIKKNREKYDAFICMYHDQALIPVKSLCFESAVNVTLGLPFIRTSVDHGTALDIAWKGEASSFNLKEAVYVASNFK